MAGSGRVKPEKEKNMKTQQIKWPVAAAIKRIEKSGVEMSAPLYSTRTGFLDDLADALGYASGRELGNVFGWGQTVAELVEFAVDCHQD